MESLRSIPFFKLLLYLVFGILLGKYFLQANWIYYALSLLLSFLLFFILHRQYYTSTDAALIKGFALFIYVFCLGIFIYKFNEVSAKTEFSQNETTYLRLKSGWKKSKKYYRAVASFNHSSQLKEGDILLNLKSDNLPDGLPGDILLSKQKIWPINSPQNPFQFDYKQYLKNQGISYSLFLKEKHFLWIKQDEFSFQKIFTQIRNHFIQILDDSPLNSSSKAFIKALLLGDKSELDAEVSEAFTIAGATHVLAVSGLHVGIIVSIFSGFFSLITYKKKTSPWVKIIFLLSIIWSFAGITGFSPSILRASIMFSFLSVGQSMQRHTSIYNSLSMAAFFMLLLDPNNLFNVGFQLSFLAVLGIVYFQPKIYRSFYFKNKIIQWLWNLSAVSIAAQLATFPLALYYFHQFPIYFLISNIIVIPSAFIVLLLSIILLCFSWLEIAVTTLSFILNNGISILNFMIISIKKLPFNRIQDVMITSEELFIILLLILLSTFFMRTKKVNYLLLSLFFSCFLFAFRITNKIQEHTSNQLLIYSIPNHLAIDIINNTEHTLLLDSLLRNNPQKLSFSVENYLRSKGLKPISECDILPIDTSRIIIGSNYLKSKNHILFKNTLLCINHSSHNIELNTHFKKRILLINQVNSRSSFEFENYTQVILNTRINDRLKEQITLNTYPVSTKNVHSLLLDGYFNLDIQ